MQYRFEYKYLINAHTSAVLRGRTKALMCPDSHSGGSYVVNSLYLDDRYDSFYYSKYYGSLHKNKYRLRYYNKDLSFIRLERKHKDGLLSYKESMQITQEQYQMVKLGNMDFILKEEAPLWQKLGAIYRTRGLRPAVSFAYRREAYTYGPGNVRFTFDGPLFNPEGSGRGGTAGYDPLALVYGRQAYHPLLLEVKYTGFLPEIVKRLLNGLPLAHTELSKYCVARERGILPYGKI